MIGFGPELVESVPFGVVLVSADSKSLARCRTLNDVAQRHVRPTGASGWSMVHSAGVELTRVTDLAEACSKELATTALALFYEDTSEWFSYSAFEHGAKVQEYSFGYIEDEEPPPDIAERVLCNENFLIFLANGFGADVSDQQLMSEHDFVDHLLRERGAYLGWEAVGS